MWLKAILNTRTRGKESIIEKLTDRKDMCTPHDDDAKWVDMFRDTVFVDGVNGGDELDKHLVIEARKT